MGIVLSEPGLTARWVGVVIIRPRVDASASGLGGCDDGHEDGRSLKELRVDDDYACTRAAQ